VLLLETHPQTPIPLAAQMLEVVREVASERVQVAYDVSNAEFVSEDQATAIRLLAPHLGQVHLSDGTRQSWRHDSVGSGTVDFGAVLAALDAIRYEGPRILEIISRNPLRDYAASKAALEMHAATSHPSQATA
jgi:L-ribulose-5-phosphate 3-epimerase